MNMDELLAGSEISMDVRQAVIDLTKLKQSTLELGRRSRIQVLDAWVVERLAALAPDGLGLVDRDQSKTHALADQMFLAAINPAPVGTTSHD